MGLAILKIKIMPDSPSAKLENIENYCKKIIEKEKGKNLRLEREPIAFGLTAVILTFTKEETEETDTLVANLEKIDEVSSVEIIDFRRAIG